MGYRLLGDSGLRVSDLWLGAMGYYEGDPDDTAPALFDTYAEAGGNVIDTAPSYGESESVVGAALEKRRDSFVVATKYVPPRANDSDDPNVAGGHRKNLRLSLEQSLRRLRTDYVDVYWVHIWDKHTPLEEMMRALDDAVRQGKILYVGISNAPAWVVARANTLAEWRDWTPFVGLQVHYNLLEREVERDLLPMAEHLGIGVTAWSPLAGGRLSGKLTASGEVADSTRFTADHVTPAHRTAARAVQDVADEIGATPAQVALAWLRGRNASVMPIVGSRTQAQLLDVVGSSGITLTPEAMRILNEASPFTAGYPQDFIASADAQWSVFDA
ncbi:aldo/keto reductase [Spiractinospora alimapuensis]|nr:aldo/keto reductase [Spiractinospora alimapuensis]